MRGVRGSHAAIPIGQFAGNPALPQGLSEVVHADQLDAMTGDPGLRLARGRGGRKFRGGGLTLQRFAGGQGGPATQEVLDALPVTSNRRRALGQFRGTPNLTLGNDTDSSS